jgi:hypothetical protein
MSRKEAESPKTGIQNFVADDGGRRNLTLARWEKVELRGCLLYWPVCRRPLQLHAKIRNKALIAETNVPGSGVGVGVARKP